MKDYVSALSPGVWYVGVDSGRGHRLCPSICSLLGDVCVHPVLDFDNMPVCNIPHRSPPQDTTDPLDYTGITHDECTNSSPLKIALFMHVLTKPCLFCLFPHPSCSRCVLTAVQLLCIW